MSISEYSTCFTKLSKHAPCPIIEEMLVKRFVRGLREYIFRFVVGSSYSNFAEVLSIVLQLEQRQKEKGGSDQNSHKKQQIEGSQSTRPNFGVGFVPGHIMRDCPVAMTQPSYSHASTPTTLASSQAPSAPVRQFESLSGLGSVMAQQSGRASDGRVQARGGRGLAQVFDMTRQDAQASNVVVTRTLSICSRETYVLFDPGATHSFISLSLPPQLGKCSCVEWIGWLLSMLPWIVITRK
ncbi:Retroviral aspartyl protease [Sesbania bispinosa]|nr:Retroviral aspartyl protease [Sesbania bispinosa]